jgi:hypothetical protein
VVLLKNVAGIVLIIVWLNWGDLFQLHLKNRGVRNWRKQRSYKWLWIISRCFIRRVSTFCKLDLRIRFCSFLFLISRFKNVGSWSFCFISFFFPVYSFFFLNELKIIDHFFFVFYCTHLLIFFYLNDWLTKRRSLCPTFKRPLKPR